MSDALSLPDYSQIKKIFHELALPIEPAECHGLLTGFLAVVPNQKLALTRLVDLLAMPDLNAADLEKIRDIAEELCGIILAQLSDPTFSFRLLLPDDTASIQLRSVATGAWCEGFLFGLGEAGLHFDDESESSQILRELVSDLTAISQIDTEDVLETEEYEVAMAELEEYLRIAAYTIYTELLLDSMEDPLAIKSALQ